MKKVYFLSPVAPLITFVAFAVSSFLLLYLEGHLFGNETRYIIVMSIAGVLCFVAWLSLIIKIQDETITRILFLTIVRTHNLSDVVSVDDMVESDVYGKQRFTQIRFENGDRWNLLMFSKKHLREIKYTLGQHRSNN